jgi:hypothetical protein
MSAFPPIADIRRCRWDVGKVPQVDIRDAAREGSSTPLRYGDQPFPAHLKALQMAVELATSAAGRHRSNTTQNLSTALRYSAATGDVTLGELAEWDPEVDEPFAPGALISSSGLSERRDFPSK